MLRPIGPLALDRAVEIAAILARQQRRRLATDADLRLAGGRQFQRRRCTSRLKKVLILFAFECFHSNAKAKGTRFA